MAEKSLLRREYSQAGTSAEARKPLKRQRLNHKSPRDKVHEWGTGRSIDPAAPFRPWSAAIIAARDSGDIARRRYLTSLIQSLLDLRTQLSAGHWEALHHVVSVRAGVVPSLSVVRDDPADSHAKDTAYMSGLADWLLHLAAEEVD